MPERKQIRVLVVEHCGRSGMYAYADSLCKGLGEVGADVTVLTSPAWPDKPVPFKVERRLSEFTRQQGGRSRLHWAADRICRSSLNSHRRNRYAIEGHFDVVHFQGAGMPLLDQFFWKPLAKRLPMVLTVHDVESHYDRFVSRDSFFRRSLHIPHCLIVHYENGKRQLVDRWDLPGDRVEVIPHGIMKPLHNPPDKIAARKKLDLPSDCRVLLFFGNIRPNKGLDVLLEAMKDICAKNPGTLLVIAGALPRGMSFQRYSDIIERLDLSKNVWPVIEFVPDEDVDCFMSASDVVVLPYKEFESQSGVLLRAYAHKKPVVVTNVGAMGELVLEDKVGMVVEPGTPDALAGAVINVLNNPGEFQSGYTNGLEKKYDWKNIAELTIGAYEKAIAIKNRS